MHKDPKWFENHHKWDKENSGDRENEKYSSLDQDPTLPGMFFLFFILCVYNLKEMWYYFCLF